MVEASPFVFEFDHIMCSMYDHVDKAHNVTDLAIMMNANDRVSICFLPRKMEGSNFQSVCMRVCYDGPGGIAH